MKKAVVFLCAIICVFGFGACTKKLPESFDRQKITQQSQFIIERLTERDFAAVNAVTRDDLKQALGEDVLSAAVEQILGNCKKVQSFKKTDIKPQTNKSTGEEYAVCVVKTEYKNKTVIYTLGFDKDMHLIMLYLR